jgi:hypothetical protein
VLFLSVVPNNISFLKGNIMLNLTLEEASFIAEVLGGIAVLFTLAYLVFEVRHNTHALKSSASQAYISTMIGNVSLINASPELADILYRGAGGLKKLSGSEAIRFGAFLDENFLTYQAFYFEWKEGLLKPSIWHTNERCMIDLLAQKGQRQWWEARRHWFENEFQEYVNERVSKEEGKPIHSLVVES